MAQPAPTENWVDVPPKGWLGERQFKESRAIWKQFFFKPADAFAQVAPNASWYGAFKQVCMYGLVSFLFGSAVSLLVSFIAAATMPTGWVSLVVALLAIPVSLLLLPFSFGLSILFSLLGSGLVYLVAKVLGGKGNFMNQYFLQSNYLVPAMLLYSALNLFVSLIQVIPSATLLLVGVSVVLFLIILGYGAYWQTLALQKAHGFSMGRAFLVWFVFFIPLVIILVFFFGLVALSAMMVPGAVAKA
ncbi:YIP1 family protein [Candidatus Micrarchaeota archaeon]|nr:YIP1 family protein [Candidatus Micrarchaeota archaeon]